jgi:hypothetical protein
MSVSETDLEESQASADMPGVRAVRFDREAVLFECEDGRILSAPLKSWPTLLLASDAERESYVICGHAVHWPLLDADIASEHLLRGTREAPVFARRAWERFLARQYPGKAA